jgi:hypothetical protein
MTQHDHRSKKGHRALSEAARMSDPINVRTLQPGTRVALVDGAVAEIVSNPADGVWLFARYLESPRDPALIGQEDMIFAQDVVSVQAP